MEEVLKQVMDKLEEIEKRTSSPWMNQEGAAEYLKMSPWSIGEARRCELLKASKVGKAYIYHRDWLDDYAMRMTVRRAQ